MKKIDTQFQTPTKKINNDKEPNEAHKNKLKEEILQVIIENFIEMLLDSQLKCTEGTEEFPRQQN
jgi:hypothetical protein